jgi:hypothetical protein
VVCNKRAKQMKPSKIPKQPKNPSIVVVLFQKQKCNQVRPCVSNFGIRKFIAHLQTSCFLSRPHTFIVAAPATWCTVCTNKNSPLYTKWTELN